MKPRRAALCSGIFILLACFFPSCASQEPVVDKSLAAEYFNIGSAWMDLKKYDKAETFLSKALEIDPTFSAAAFNLARVLTESGKAESAIPSLEVILNDEPDNLLVLKAYAYAKVKMGDFERAKDLYARILELSPYEADALYNIAVVLRTLGMPSAAIPPLAKLVELNPQDPESLLQLGLSESEAGLYEDSIPHLYSYLDIKQRDPKALLGLARSHAESGEKEKALGKYREYLEQNPNKPEVLFELASLQLVDADLTKEGMEAMKKSLELGFKNEVKLGLLLNNEKLIDKKALEDLIAARKSAEKAAEEMEAAKKEVPVQ